MSRRQNGAPPTISVVFSFRNEESSLPELLTRTSRTLDGEKAGGSIRDYELIFVDDDSTDDSRKILARAIDDGLPVRIITMSRRFGVSPCVMAGMRYATGDAVVYLDADLQDPPELIPKMIAAWTSGHDVDVVHTQRILRKGESAFRRAANWLGYSVLGRMSSIPIYREVGDYKLLSRRVVDHLLSLREPNPFLRGLVVWVGFTQVIVPYEREPRFAGETKFPALGSKVVANFLDSALISFSAVPLKLSLILGSLTMVLALGYATWVFAAKFLGGTVDGYASLMIVLLLSTSLQAIFHGVAGLYLYSIYQATRQRPPFIVRSVSGFPEASAAATCPASADARREVDRS